MSKLKILIPVVLIVAAFSSGIFAGSSISSKGKLVFDNGTEDTSDDVIFDASDLTTIETEVSNGKTNLKTAINTATGTNIINENIPSFESLVNGISEVKTAGENKIWTDINDMLVSEGKDGIYGTIGSVDDLKTGINAEISTLSSGKAIYLGQYSGNSTIDVRNYGIDPADVSNYTASNVYAGCPTWSTYVNVNAGEPHAYGTASVTYNNGIINISYRCYVTLSGSTGNAYPSYHVFFMP